MLGSDSLNQSLGVVGFGQFSKLFRELPHRRLLTPCSKIVIIDIGIGRIAAFVVIESKAKNSRREHSSERVPWEAELP
jgi:hypothetical protein